MEFALIGFAAMWMALCVPHVAQKPQSRFRLSRLHWLLYLTWMMSVIIRIGLEANTPTLIYSLVWWSVLLFLYFLCLEFVFWMIWKLLDRPTPTII